MKTPLVTLADKSALQDLEQLRAFHESFLGPFRYKPVNWVMQFCGMQPDPWQCDALDVLADPAEFNVAVRSCHGVGKTALEAWAALWFNTTRWESEVISTASTYVHQVKDVLWGQGMHHWWSLAVGRYPVLKLMFDMQVTQLKAIHPELAGSWFAVGIPSKNAASLEGYHARSILLMMDEARAIPAPMWHGIHGMRASADEAKFLAASTPGGPTSEFSKIFTEYRTTWKRTFIIHPEALRARLGRKEAEGRSPKTGLPTSGMYAKGGTYYSKRTWTPEMVAEREAEWGSLSPVFISKVVGDIPTQESNKLLKYDQIMAAEARETCEARGCHCSQDGVIAVGCDVARSGVDRTVIYVVQGGRILHGEAVSRNASETTLGQEAMKMLGEVGLDPKQPLYRDTWATAALCVMLAKKYGAGLIGVDDTGLGVGVTDGVRRSGYHVVPIKFGGNPTDIPKDKESKDWKIRRFGIETAYYNLKAQMAVFMRNGFDHGHICLAELDDDGQKRNALLLPLVAQLAATRTRVDDNSYFHVEDPNDVNAADQTFFDDPEESKRSPDHMHALMIAWWLSGGGHRPVKPQGGRAVHQGRAEIGRPGPSALFSGGAGTVPQGSGQAPRTSHAPAGRGLQLSKLI